MFPSGDYHQLFNEELAKQLSKLGLNLNKNKTEYYDNILDFLPNDAMKLAESGKVSEIFKEIEPARVRQYYNQKEKSVTKDKEYSQ